MQSHHCKVSLIVPVFNAELYLTNCINSVLNQTEEDIQLVLINDGSTDDSLSICNYYSDLDTRVTVINQKNMGVEIARNAGLQIASGEYVWFLDSDDWISNNAIEELYSLAKKYNADCIMQPPFKYISENNYSKCEFFTEEFVANQRQEIDALQKFILNPPSHPLASKKISIGYIGICSKFVKNELLQRNHVYFNKDFKGLFEDGMWTLELLDYAETVLYCSTCYYYYRQIDDSQIHRFRDDIVMRRYFAFESIDKWLLEKEKDETFKQEFYIHVVLRFTSLLSKYYFNQENSASWVTIRKELESALDLPIIYQASLNVDIRSLKIYNSYIVYCIRKHSVSGLKLYVYMKNLRDQFKNKLRSGSSL